MTKKKQPYLLGCLLLSTHFFILCFFDTLVHMKLRHSLTLSAFLIGITFSGMPSIVVAKNIPLPFTPQAPDNKWIQPWQDLCEEASVLMVDQYYRKGTLSKPRAKQLLLHIFELKNKHYGKSLDESTEKITNLINHFLAWEATVVENPTLDQIKEQLDLDQPVIVPVSGKDLGNPHFRNGGPRYHVLVISGYDDKKQEFITAEPGTHVGLDFRYAYDTILNANHDLILIGNIRDGAKRMIFTTAKAGASLPLDGDKDGLTKAEELALGTSLTDTDSDKDGFSDGTEVASGYSPLLNENKLGNNALVKSADDPSIYLLSNKAKRKIASETAFIQRGWKWQNIKTVSERFLSSLKTGAAIE